MAKRGGACEATLVSLPCSLLALIIERLDAQVRATLARNPSARLLTLRLTAARVPHTGVLAPGSMLPDVARRGGAVHHGALREHSSGGR